jgi:hypothetical protein
VLARFHPIASTISPVVGSESYLRACGIGSPTCKNLLGRSELCGTKPRSLQRCQSYLAHGTTNRRQSSFYLYPYSYTQGCWYSGQQADSGDDGARLWWNLSSDRMVQWFIARFAKMASNGTRTHWRICRPGRKYF